MIRAICYDMDGVLVEAQDWHYMALNRALRHFGLEISRADHLHKYNGLPTRAKLESLATEGNLSRTLIPLISELKQIYTQRYFNRLCQPIFHQQYALARLQRHGYRQAVCSNSIRSTVEMMVEQGGLRPYLDLILSNEDIAHSKPHPAIYLKAIATFQLRPEEILVLEDNKNGIEAAKAAGTHLLIIRHVSDVTFANILRRIEEVNAHAAIASAA